MFATKQWILSPTKILMFERIPISKWKAPMLAFTTTMIVAGYVRTGIHTARHESQVGRQQKLAEIEAARRARITELTPKPD